MNRLRFSWNVFWMLVLTSLAATAVFMGVMHSVSPTVTNAERLAIAFVAAMTTAILVSVLFARRWSTQIHRIRTAMEFTCQGSPTTSIILGADELSGLARSFLDRHHELITRLRSIDRQHQTLSSLIKQLHEGVMVVDAQNHVVLLNPAAVKLLRLAPQRPGDNFEGLEVERCIPYHNLQEILTADHSQKSPPREIQLHLDEPNGSTCILARAYDIDLSSTDESATGTNRETKSIGRLLLMSDITELNQLIQMKTDFVANASHELRTPLASLLTALETLQSSAGHQDEESNSRLIAIMERNAHRMEALVKDLLELSRIEAPSSHFAPSPLNTAELLRELHSNFANALAARNIQWHANAASDCDTIVAHAGLLRIVLNNLVENAIRFTSPGGNVEIDVQSEPHAFRMEVSDTGCGIAPEDQPRVFERFFQVSRARSGSDRGTGLGLAIVRHAVIAMNGAVSLQSSEGRGTRVIVTLPRG